MDGDRFDAIARKLAPKSPRRAALGVLAGAAIAGFARGDGAGAAPVQTEATCRGNFCDGNVSRCRVDGTAEFCVCYRSPDGGFVCAAPFGRARRCGTDRDCAAAGLRGYRCVRNGRRCAGGAMENVCAAPCKATRPGPAEEARGAGGWNLSDG